MWFGFQSLLGIPVVNLRCLGACTALIASGVGMIAGGIIVALVWDRFRIVGVSIAFAGVIALITLLPPVQAWIQEKANTPYDGDGNPDD